jgi:hypothetical protein
MARIIRRADTQKKKCFFFCSKQRSFLDRFGAEVVQAAVAFGRHRCQMGWGATTA